MKIYVLTDRQTDRQTYISNLPIDEILRALPPRTVMRISPSAKASFQDCCAIALRKLQEDPMYVPAWKLLFLIPRMVLQPQGKSSSAEIKKIFHKFLDFRWDELIQLNAPQLTRRRPNNANNESHLRAAALRLVRCGELARASRLLTSPGLAAATAETTKKLASKHPSRVSPLNVRPPNVQEPFILSKKIFFETIRRSPRGTGTGPSGWRYEHLKALLDNCSTADLLHSVCSSIASGSIPESTLNLLTASRLIAIPKPNGDVRPIAIGEALRRLTAKSICAQKKDSFAQFFSPLQHGVATKGGAELLVHQVQLLLEENKDWIVLKSDVRNAFNSVSRSHFLIEVARAFPDIFGHVNKMYSGVNPLVYLQESTPIILSSEEGIHQGDPLGPALFSSAIHNILVSLQEQNQDVRVRAYLDDVFLLGPAEKVLATFSQLDSAFSHIHLQVAPEKCEIFSPSEIASLSVPSSCQIPVTSDGMMVLGSPIGIHDYVSSTACDIAGSGAQLCQELLQLDDTQSSMLLLRYCHVPRLNFLARTILPGQLQLATSIHDQQSRSCFSALMKCNNFSSQQWEQIVLPIRKGGFGLTAMAPVRTLAFLSSWAFSIKELPLRFPILQPLIDAITNASPIESSIGKELQQALPSNKSLLVLASHSTKLQHRLTEEFMETKINCLMEDTPTTRDAARLRSLQGKGAGAWLEAVPSSQKLALKPSEFRLASFLRLGHSMPFSSLINNCNCGRPVDDSGYHLLTCKTGGGPVWTHNSIVSVWSDCLKIHHKKEPRNRFTNTDDRPDITCFNCGSGSSVELDVAMAHPWSSDIFPTSAITDGAAARRREKRKEDKYQHERLPAGDFLSFVPLVFEHFGRWGEKAEGFLKELSKESTDEDGHRNTCEFVGYWRKRLSLQIQKCNAGVILKKLSSLTELMDYDISSFSDMVVQEHLH